MSTTKRKKLMLDEFTRGRWREKLDGVKPGYFRTIYDDVETASGVVRFAVLEFSAYYPETDKDKDAVHTRSSDFDDEISFLTRLVIHSMTTRVITHRGTPRWILEPGPDALEYAAAREGVSPQQLVRAARQGQLGRRIARNARKPADRKRLLAEAEIADLKATVAELEDEMSLIEKERRSLERIVSRQPAE